MIKSVAMLVGMARIRNRPKTVSESTVSSTELSGKKKEPKPKFFGSDVSQWGKGSST